MSDIEDMVASGADDAGRLAVDLVEEGDEMYPPGDGRLFERPLL